MSGLAPVLLVMLPLEFVGWGWQYGALHIVFQLASGVLLIVVLFWSFGKVPFTCSYFPGKINLALLAAIYLYGFTSYSFRMADLERAIEGQWGKSILVFAAAGVALVSFWRRHPEASAISFDAAEPHIQTLDLN